MDRDGRKQSKGSREYSAGIPVPQCGWVELHGHGEVNNGLSVNHATG
jgi:hypothetical protein